MIGNMWRMPPIPVLVDSTGVKIYGARPMAGREARRKVPAWLAKRRLAVDADSGEIIVNLLTDQETDDASHLEPAA